MNAYFYDLRSSFFLKTLNTICQFISEVFKVKFVRTGIAFIINACNKPFEILTY